MPSPLFKTKSIKIETLGEYLGQMRVQLNMDVKTVSLLTQIKPQYLEQLEKGNWEKLPADVYIRGFLKSLAQLYHVQEQVLIDQYDKEHGFGQVKKPTVHESRFRISFTPKTVIIGLTIILSLAAVTYVASQISSVLTPPLLELNEPGSDVNIQGNSVIFSGRAEIGADVRINEQAVLTDKNGEFTENLILSAGLNVIEIAVKNKFNKESRITRRVNAELPENGEAEESLPVNITLEIGPNSAWIYMEADGIVVQRGTMLPGSTKTITANEEVLLTSANAGSTKVIYNERDLGKLGRETEVIRNVEFRSTNQQAQPPPPPPAGETEDE
jgi:cytoskeletal protein RodZ